MNFGGNLLANGTLIVRFLMLLSAIVHLPGAIYFSWYFLLAKLAMNPEP
jgi:hypothetical protein